MKGSKNDNQRYFCWNIFEPEESWEPMRKETICWAAFPFIYFNILIFCLIIACLLWHVRVT